MQSVGKFDKQDAHVIGNGKKQFAVIFGLLLFFAGKLDTR